MTTLSVVVPATDQPPTLPRCRAALRAATGPDDEVIVVDTPGLNASEARNAGARRATGDVVVFVDSDVEVHPDALDRIRATLAPGSGVDAVFGSYDDHPAHPGLVSTFRNLLHHHVHHRGAGPADTFWTGLGALRRDRFVAAGGFDHHRYPLPSIEDIELGHRLRALGATVVLDPTIQGTHLKAWSLRSMLWTDFARRGVPWVALQVRARRIDRALNCGRTHRASAAVSVLAVVAALVAAPLALAVAVAALVWLNRRFYAVLWRRTGAWRTVVGVALHGAHHLVAVAAVPVGIAAGLWPARARAAPEPDPALAPSVGE